MYIILIYPVILEVDEDPVNQHHPESRTGKIEFITAQAEFGMIPGNLKHLSGTLRHIEQKINSTDHRPHNQDDALDGIGPDNSLYTPQDSIYHNRHPGYNDHRFHVPSIDGMDHQGQQV